MSKCADAAGAVLRGRAGRGLWVRWPSLRSCISGAPTFRRCCREPARTNNSVHLASLDDATTAFSARGPSTTKMVWASVFRDQLAREYTPPKVVIFSGVPQSPCGGAKGPFCCPADSKAYPDTEFFTALDRQMGAGGYDSGAVGECDMFAAERL